MPKEPQFSDYYKPQPTAEEWRAALHRRQHPGPWVYRLSILVNTLVYMDAKLTKIYYSPKGYWKGMTAIKKLANTAKVSEDEAKQWLTKQALWQVYLPGPKYILSAQV